MSVTGLLPRVSKTINETVVTFPILANRMYAVAIKDLDRRY